MEHVINFIGRHIQYNPANLEECDTICAFTGEKITEGIRKKIITKSNFTDYEYLKFESDYVCINAYKLLAETIPSANGKINSKGTLKYNSLRNYSYFVNNTAIKTLNKEDLWDFIIKFPNPPYVLCYTFSSKKHTAFKAKINTDKDKIYVMTDQFGNIKLTKNIIDELCPIVQNWYSATTKMKAVSTYFCKEEILVGTDNFTKINEYGVDKYFKEDKILKKYRNTNILTLLVRLVNRELIE